jgi:hypothetical protein
MQVFAVAGLDEIAAAGNQSTQSQAAELAKCPSYRGLVIYLTGMACKCFCCASTLCRRL